jgi:N-sulfoglucosamine sulfohydrolase
MKPDRWPAGDPQRIKPGTENELLPMFGIDENGVHHSEWAFADVDACPSKAFLAENHKMPEMGRYFDWAFAKRPEYELFDLKKDPFCLTNLAGDPNYSDPEKKLKQILFSELEKSADPRVTGPDREIFDSYIRYSPMREFPKPE